MTLDEWKKQRPPVSRWRRHAREVMRDVIAAIEIMDPALLTDRREVLKRVDAVYPFGERAMEPYRCWLKERHLLIAACAGDIPMPTADEVGVCEVARDLVELGRYDEARALVESQAPNRLAMRCAACGAKSGEDCFNATTEIEQTPRDMPGAGRIGYAFVNEKRFWLIVPHHARLVDHRGAGPLFREQSR